MDGGHLSGLAKSLDGGFLVSANDAIFRVAWPTEWSVIGREYGASGSLSGVAEWRGALFLMSSSGALRATRNSEGALGFEADPWGSLTVHDIYSLGDDRALLARHHRLALVEDGRVRDLSEEILYPRMFRASKFDPSRVYLGTEAGLRVLNVSGWIPQVAPAFQPGLEMRVSSLAERSLGEVWAGTERHGLWRYRFADDGSISEARRFGEADGLLLGPIQEAAVALLADGSLMVGTHAGLFHMEGERFIEFGLDGLAALRLPDELLRPLQSANGEQWAFGDARLFRRPKGGVWSEQDIANLRRGAWQGYYFDSSGRALFISDQAILLHDPSAATNTGPVPQVLLREVTQIHAGGRRQPLPLQSASPVQLTAGDFVVNFQFALPDLTSARGHRYQVRLLGYEADYSEWSKSRSYSYSQLSPGTYVLQIRGMDSHGRVSVIDPYTLVIVPRWYASTWARVTAALLAAAVVWLLAMFFVRRRTFRLADDKLKLEATVEARTYELAQANRRLEMMANLDGLTGIPNRRRLDEYLSTVWEQCMELARPLSVLLIDVDHFKRFNDHSGHLAGDELLKQLVRRLAHCLRRSEDMLARYGGEEFLVVLPGADLSAAHVMAEAMRHAVEEAGLGASISIGVASRIPGAGEVVTLLIAQADAALYAAKGGGRNRVETHREPGEQMPD